MQDGAKYREPIRLECNNIHGLYCPNQGSYRTLTTEKLENSYLHTYFIQPWVSRPEAKSDSIKHSLLVKKISGIYFSSQP